MPNSLIDYRLPEELEGTVLEKIMRARLPEIAGAKKKWPGAAIRKTLERSPDVRSFRQALMRRKPAVIAEIKKASPSAGVFRADFNADRIAQEYERAGAAAISVVTEVKHFLGGLETLARLRWSTRAPLLRKDFVVDSYQVLEARHAGADAILLIAALLDGPALASLRAETENCGMEALVEVHTDRELERALEAGATLIGVNNRDLRSFDVSLDVSFGLAGHFPEGIVAVAESGIRSAEDIRLLSDAGYRGFLIGERFLRAVSPGAALSQLLQQAVARRAS